MVTQHKSGGSDCHFFLLSYNKGCAGSVAPAPSQALPTWATIAPSAKEWGGQGSRAWWRGSRESPRGSWVLESSTADTEDSGVAACLGPGIVGRGLLYKVTLRGGRCFGPETLLGSTGRAERGASTWLPRMPRLPAQPARGRLPDLTPPTGANGPPTWSALQTPSRFGTLLPAPAH